MLTEQHILDVAVLAGRVMMEHGAEMHRIEDTMDRIINHAYGQNIANSFVVPTAIFSGVRYGDGIRMRRIYGRTHNLMKVDVVNDLSRQFSRDDITLDQLEDALKSVEASTYLSYKPWFRILMSSVAAASTMVLFGGGMQDFVMAALIGGLGYSIYLWIQTSMNIKYIPEFIASLVIGLSAIWGFRLGLISSIDSVIVGGIMMLVPGVSLANSIRDFFAGHTISGTIFLADTILIGAMIGFGVSVSFYIL